MRTKGMPELPEVETIRRQLEPEIRGRRSSRSRSSMSAGRGRCRRPRSSGRSPVARSRRSSGAASTCCCGWTAARSLAMHLRMTGNLLLDRRADRPTSAPAASATLRAACTSRARARRRARLLFTDARRFGQAVVLDGDGLDDYFAARLGVEPLSEALTARGALPAGLGAAGAAEVVPAEPERDRRDREHLRRRGAPSGGASPAVAGRVDEARGLRARCATGSSPRSRRGCATAAPRSTTTVDARGERGAMQDEFLVHTREGEPCPRCGAEIRRIVVAGRSTYFCPACQRRLRRRPRRRARRGLPDDRRDPTAGRDS